MQPLSPRNSILVQQSGQKLWTSATISPHPAQRGGSAKSSNCLNNDRMSLPASTRSLSPVICRRTSASMTSDLFDERIGALRRSRALKRGRELFLHERAFDDIHDRLSIVRRRFRSALLINCLDPAWPERLREHADMVKVIEPERVMEIEPGSFDLCVAIGWLDTANDLPGALLTARFALEGDSLFIGAISGGDTLPALRAAMRSADERMDAATPHAHPRIEPAALTNLLTSAGFAMPVVDVDRVQVRYKELADLVRDLRSMGATNILRARSGRPLSRAAVNSAEAQFLSGAEGGRVTEMFEILHFAAWTPAAPNNG